MMQLTTARPQKSALTRQILAIVGVILIQGCGGGGGSSSGVTNSPPVTEDPPPATTTSVTTTGVITGFGSVFVNGVEYETDTAEIESDDAVADESDLRVGQVVTLKGSKNDDDVTGTAESIAYDNRVEGPIASISDNALVVLGQTIIVNDATVFDDSVDTQSVAGLSIDDVIEVSGFLNSNGDIEATYIEVNAPGGEFELVGIVSGLDSNASTFDIGSQSIDFSGAVLQDFDGALLADGDPVEVKGSTFGAGGELIATIVELEGNDFSADDEVEVEGLITRFESAGDFAVSGIDVATTSATQFEGGTAADLALDVKVEVEGSIDTGGILIASKVEFRIQENTRFEAVVDSTNPGEGKVTVLGIDIQVTATTQLEDDSQMRMPSFGLDNISMGDFLEVRGKLEGDGTVTATRVERDDPEDESSVRGLVQTTDGATTLSIAGVTILTDESTKYRNELDVSMDKVDFFAAALAGVEVKAKGLETGTSEITAAELELEDNN